MDQSADYVVAGAGSAGCVLARRLAQAGASVILLEAGGPDRSRLVRKPGMIAIFHNVPALKKRLDWGFKRMEDWEGGASDLRGVGGPVKVTSQQDLTPAAAACRT